MPGMLSLPTLCRSDVVLFQYICLTISKVVPKIHRDLVTNLIFCGGDAIHLFGGIRDDRKEGTSQDRTVSLCVQNVLFIYDIILFNPRLARTRKRIVAKAITRMSSGSDARFPVSTD